MSARTASSAVRFPCGSEMIAIWSTPSVSRLVNRRAHLSDGACMASSADPTTRGQLDSYALVCARSASSVVVSGVAEQLIFAAATSQVVVAGSAGQDVRAVGPDESVGRISANRLLDAEQG